MGLEKAYYRLHDNYALRGYEGRFYVLVAWGSTRAMNLNARQFTLLQKCDGKTPLEPAALTDAEFTALEFFVAKGFVEPLEAPAPMRKSRTYRYFAHKRRFMCQWNITNKCNLNCIHCVNSEEESFHGHHCTIDEARVIAGRLVEHGIETVSLFGGEPMANPDFLGICQLLSDADINITCVSTNGLMLDDHVLSSFKAMGQHPRFTVSFDGLGTHDWMRNMDGCEERTINIIRSLIAQGYKVGVNVNVNMVTAPRLKETCDFLVGLGVDELRIVRTGESPRWFKTTAGTDAQLMPEPEFDELMVEMVEHLIAHIRKGLTLNCYVGTNIRPMTTGADIFGNKPQPANATPILCMNGTYGINVGSMGHVLYCKGCEGFSALNNLLTDECSLLHRSAADIYADSWITEVDRATCDQVLANEPSCQKCDMWPKCYGGSCKAYASNPPSFKIDAQVLTGKNRHQCALYKGGYIQRIAKILDDNPPLGR